MKTHPIQRRLAKVGKTQTDLAVFMGVDPSTLSNKFSGKRRFSQWEINAVLAYFRQFGSRAVTYEALFGNREAAA